MPSRRAHTKTRHGCQACKRRKIRCDLIQPVCRNCDRNKELCSFSDGKSQQAVLPFSVVPKPREHIGTEENRLLQTYTAFTSKTLTDRRLQSDLWQICVPQLAASSRYLQDGVLALVVLHERCLARSNNKAYFIHASDHTQRALKGFTKGLEAIDHTNCDALFASTMLFGCLSFGLLSCQQACGSNSGDTIDEVLSVFEMLNGIVAVANQVRPLLHGGSLSRMLDRVPDPTDLMLEGRQQRTVQGRRITEHERDDSTQECRVLTARLQSTLRSAGVGGVSQDHAIVWPLSLSKNLKTRMRHRDPAALILLAHYGLLLCFFENRSWFLQGIGPRLVHTIAGELPTEQRKQILWIERFLGNSMMGNSF